LAVVSGVDAVVVARRGVVFRGGFAAGGAAVGGVARRFNAANRATAG